MCKAEADLTDKLHSILQFPFYRVIFSAITSFIGNLHYQKFNPMMPISSKGSHWICNIFKISTIWWIWLAWFTSSIQPVHMRGLSNLMLSMSMSTYVSSGLNMSTEVRYSRTTSTIPNYSGPNLVVHSVWIQKGPELPESIHLDSNIQMYALIFLKYIAALDIYAVSDIR